MALYHSIEKFWSSLIVGPVSITVRNMSNYSSDYSIHYYGFESSITLNFIKQEIMIHDSAVGVMDKSNIFVYDCKDCETMISSFGFKFNSDTVYYYKTS